MCDFRLPRLGLPHLVLALVLYPLADPEPAHAAVQAEAPAALPAPTGSHTVGRVTLHWIDEMRRASAPAPVGPRELMVDW